MQVYNSDHWLQKMAQIPRQAKYYSMYSSLVDGIVTDPTLMAVPIDDHIVHRGDGVFEAFRMSFGAVFDVDSHLARLNRSADAIGMTLPKTNIEIKSIIRELCKFCSEDDAIVRLYVSRGPGGFTTNPYETVGSQLYVVVTEFRQPSEAQFNQGVSVKTSSVPMKPNPWHQIKSCNYLPNVMMKKEAKDAGVDFVVSVTQEGFFGEGSTENFALIVDDELVVPSYDYTLRGTTLNRLIGLAESNLTDLDLKKVSIGHVPSHVVKTAQEAFFIGTTIEVLPITMFDGSAVADGKVGPRSQKLRQLLLQEMRTNKEVRLEL